MAKEITTLRVVPEIDLTSVREFVKTCVIPRAAENDKTSRFDREHVAKLHAMGLLASITPAHLGGKDLPLADLIWITRELAYGSAGLSGTFIGNLLGYSAFVLYAQDALKEKVCAEFMAKPGLWSFAMSEKGCGSDLPKTATRARRVSGGFVINGEKNFITNGSHSTHLSVFANLEESEGRPGGISGFYVPGNTAGLERSDGVEKLGWRESNTAHVFFKDVFVPESHLLGEVGQGLKILSHCLCRSKALLAATSVGISTRALDLVRARLVDTVRYDKSLAEQPGIRHLVARLETKLTAAWYMTAAAAAAWDQGLPAVTESAMAKLFAGATGTEITNQAVELFGARGFLAEFDVSRLYRDAKATEILEGPSLVQEVLIARAALPLPMRREARGLSLAKPETGRKAA